MTISVDAVDIVVAARNDPQTYARLEAELCNTDGTVPLHKRFRALFTLKSLADAPAVDIIDKAFIDPSALLKHELAYVLGQMRNPHALICLERVLRDQQEDPMVRHEAAEAIGAISKEDSLPLLEEYAKDDSRVVRETCELAIAKIKFEAKKAAGEESEDARCIRTGCPYAFINVETNNHFSNSAYTSVDPAPPVPKKAEKSTAQLRDQLLDTTVSLFDRYRAMFALRNRGDVESVLALAEGLNDDSALFRHEIAYVFGQMQHPASVPALIKSLTNTTEEGMVRHECAEALGSIATPEVFPVLKQFAKDENIVVRDSCIVGLDMFEHETSGEFQYADGLTAH